MSWFDIAGLVIAYVLVGSILLALAKAYDKASRVWPQMGAGTALAFMFVWPIIAAFFGPFVFAEWLSERIVKRGWFK